MRSVKAMRKLILLLVIFASIVLIGCMPAEEFRDQENYVENCPGKFFDKSAVIFNSITICGTNMVSNEKLTHAAQVTAQWLDNDQNGNADEPRLLMKLEQEQPIVFMSSEEFSIGNALPIITSIGERPTQALFAHETNPADARDASQEEIHHIIMNAGWIKLYPQVFGDMKKDNSDLYKAWAFAEENNFYFYDDPTCNDSCKVTEFVYLATAAYLGLDADLFSDEMRLKTRQQLQTSIPAIIEIFESENYIYPLIFWPNGKYNSPNNIQYF